MAYTPVTGPRPEDIKPNAFGSAGNVVGNVEVQSLYTRPIPERTWTLERHVGYLGFCASLDMNGFVDGTDTPTVGHYEAPWREDIVKVGSITTPSGGAGTPVIFELHADCMYDPGTTSGGSSIQASFPLQNDVLELFDGTRVQITLKDASVNPHRLTVEPLDSTIDLAGKITANDEYGVSDNAHFEGDGLPKGRAPRFIKYTNDFQIVKNTYSMTGSEMTNAIYNETVPGDESSARKSVYRRLKNDTVYHYEAAKGHALLFGKQGDGNISKLVTNTNIDTPLKTTEGLIPFGVTNGYVDPYTPGLYALADLYAITDSFYDERVATVDMLCSLDGPDISSETEQAFTNVFVNNLEPYIDRFMNGYGGYRKSQLVSQGYYEGIDSKEYEMSAAFGFNAATVNGFTFSFKRLDELGDIKRQGSSSYKYRGYRIVYPFAWNTDARSGNRRATVGYEYKKSGEYSRLNVVGSLSGAMVGGDNTPFGPAVNEFDSHTGFIGSEMAGHWALGNGIVIQRPV